MTTVTYNWTKPCIQANTRPNTTGSADCSCYLAFYGDYCENSYAFYDPVFIVEDIVSLLTMTYLIIWSILKFTQLVRDNRFKLRKLSSAALIMAFLGAVCRLAYTIGSWAKSHRNFAPDPATYISLTILVTLPSTFWMASTSLILGFWFDVLQHKLRPRMASSTRIVCIIGACLMLLTIPGFILLLRLNLKTIGTVLIVLPLITNIVGIVVILIMIAVVSSKKLSAANKAKKDYATRVMIVSVVTWVVFIIVLLLYDVGLQNPKIAVFVSFPLDYINVALNFILGGCILWLCDRGGGVIALIRYFASGKPYDSITGTSTRTSTTTSSSKASNDSTSSSPESGAEPARKVSTTATSTATSGDARHKKSTSTDERSEPRGTTTNPTDDGHVSSVSQHSEPLSVEAGEVGASDSGSDSVSAT